MVPTPSHRLLALGFAAALGTLAPPALADTSPQAAAAATASLEADPTASRVAKEVLGRARAALQRAERMRAAGDQDHARMSEAVAAAFVDAAHAIVQAHTAQDATSALQAKVLAAKAQLERERALAEEAMMRKGQLETQLAAALEAKGKREEPAAKTPQTPPKSPAKKGAP